MKRALIFVQNPNALKNWLSANGSDSKILTDLESLDQRFDTSNVILLIQLSEKVDQTVLSKLSQQHFDILAFSDKPSNAEGIQLFKLGIKGYLNTHASASRIQQAIITIEAGSIWLGSSIMQAMIEKIGQTAIKNSGWKTLLTHRENQVVKLVLEKKSNLEISGELDITERTVKSHLHNTFEKLNVSDRLALALRIHNW